MFLLSSILQTISGSWEAQQLLVQVFKKKILKSFLVKFYIPNKDGGQLYNYQDQQEEMPSMQVSFGDVGGYE